MVAVLTAIYALIGRYTDFRHDNKLDPGLVNQVLMNDDIKSTLLEPLYYTFKTKSYRYKSTKFGVLDNVAEQVRSLSGESVLHYMLWSALMGLLVAEFCIFSPKICNVKNPDLGNVSLRKVIDQIEKDIE
jgi:hypothetical protein